MLFLSLVLLPRLSPLLRPAEVERVLEEQGRKATLLGRWENEPVEQRYSDEDLLDQVTSLPAHLSPWDRLHLCVLGELSETLSLRRG